MLYQIIDKQKRLQEAYALRAAKKPKTAPPDKSGVVESKLVDAIIAVSDAVKAAKSAEPTPVPEPASALKEKTIAVALPLSMHKQAEQLMVQLKYKGSKREFVQDVLASAFTVLGPVK